MFSVIIPLYNKSAHIEKTIDSVLEQTHKEFELILVNDGSTDDGPEKVIKYKDSRIRIIDQQNSGVSTARNNGVKVAKFDYVAFLDADDWWEPTYLEEMTVLIEEFTQAGVYGSKYFWVKNGKIKESVNHESNEFKGYIDYLKAYTFAWWMPLTSISTVIPKKIFLEEKGFKQKLKFGEDFDLWIRLSLKHKVAYINKPLAYYNQDVSVNQRALGRNKKWEPSEHFIFNLEYLHEEERENPILKQLLDGLRVRNLILFRINGWHKNKVEKILKLVGFHEQPDYYRRIYQWPIMIVKVYFQFKTIGSNIKQMLKFKL